MRLPLSVDAAAPFTQAAGDDLGSVACGKALDPSGNRCSRALPWGLLHRLTQCVPSVVGSLSPLLAAWKTLFRIESERCVREFIDELPSRAR